MVRSRRYFGKNDPIVPPSDNMSRTRDVDFGRESISFDRSRLQHLEKFRVERSPIQLKGEFGDFGANDWHDKRNLGICPNDFVNLLLAGS
jgi:hypothetical protein